MKYYEQHNHHQARICLSFTAMNFRPSTIYDQDEQSGFRIPILVGNVLLEYILFAAAVVVLDLAAAAITLCVEKVLQNRY
jgi:hypothetical protein